MKKSALAAICFVVALAGGDVSKIANAQEAPVEVVYDAGSSDSASAVAPPDAAVEEEAPKKDAEESSEKKDENKSVAPDSPLDQGKGAIEAGRDGNWIMMFGFIGMLLGSLLRFGMSQKWKFWETKTGGYTIAALTGLGILGYEIVQAGGAFSVSFLMPALAAMAASMGMHGPAKGLKKKLTGEAA